MNFDEVGEAHSFLILYRVVETKSSSRRISSNEKRIANYLLQFSQGEQKALDGMFKAYGFKLKRFDSDEMPGIPRNGISWLLLRNTDVQLPEHYSTVASIRGIAIRDGESLESLSVWFLHIWLICLSQLYSINNRSPSQVSQYLSASLSRDSLTNAVRNHIESIRSIGIGVYTSILWFKLLTQIKSRQSNACHMSQFFDGMFFQNLKA